MPLDDVSDAPIDDHLDAAVAFVRDALADGGRVYVHCAMGVSRSATVVIAYRMTCCGEVAPHLNRLQLYHVADIAGRLP